ncbi:MAG: DUF4407 domain-containing protein [Bacteroidetes bacterium]|nr:DUF4407 domain-containing protein [Bacteroidota bacterium]
MKERDYYITPKSNRVMRFLWKAAGGDRYLLERATYSDQVKYMCLGGIVFATGAMAGLAGGYAFYTIFSPKTADVLDKTKTLLTNATYIPTDPMTVVLSVIFGIIWGLIIFNIDRFIVTSTGKGDGTEAITWEELKGAIPRIIMGMIIAITISKPVEIRMFKTEIDLAVQKQQKKEIEDGILQAQANYDKKVAETKTKMNKSYKRLDEIDSLVNYLTVQFNKEVRGEGGSVPGYEKRARAIESQIIQLKDEKIKIVNNSEYLDNVAEQKRLQGEFNSDVKEAEKRAATLDGLLIRIQKAHEIAGWVISLFITLLFMAIELTPVFFKLMLIKTPYDYLAENRDELIKAENGIEVRYDYYKDKVGQERHLVINHEAHKLVYEKIKVTEIQKELTDYAVEQYKNREKKKIDENLDDYIKNISPDEPGNPQA